MLALLENHILFLLDNIGNATAGDVFHFVAFNYFQLFIDKQCFTEIMYIFTH